MITNYKHWIDAFWLMMVLLVVLMGYRLYLRRHPSTSTRAAHPQTKPLPVKPPVVSYQSETASAYNVDAGYNVDISRYTPLMNAAKNKDVATVKSLLANGAKVDERNEDGETALMIAANFVGNTQVVKTLLAHKADMNARTNRYRETALMSAASTGDTECVKLLLDHGADVNAEAGFKSMGSPLMHAVIKNIEGFPPSHSLSVIKLLLARGANPNTYIIPLVAHATRTSPLSYARDGKRYDIVDLLIKAGAKK